MKKTDITRLLGVSEKHMEYGRKHLKILDHCGRLVLIVSKGPDKLDGPWMKAARKVLLAHGLIEKNYMKRPEPLITAVTG